MSTEIHVLLAGSTAVRRFTDTVRVGRADTNGMVLDDDRVSAEHLEFRRGGEAWEIVDLGSTNGTFLNGVHVARAALGRENSVRLGSGGPELRVNIPGLVKRAETRRLSATDIAARFLGSDAPEEMSRFTAMIRAAVQERRALEITSWLRRIRTLRVAIGVLLALTAGAASFAVWQAHRVSELRATAGDVFNTMKSVELAVRRLQAVSGPDRSIQERRARLEAQYEQLVKTLGIYSARTPADVQLIYRIVHRLGESEATVPRAFVNEVRRYIAQWKAQDLLVGLTRANAEGLGLMVSGILLQHHLPREFFYLAFQESRLDPKAIGPSTRLGFPKGLWQFIPSTAQAYGLRLGPLRGDPTFDPNDERHDVARSTEAAARYLEDIYTTDAQASGLLVMASYNMGETRILPLIRSMPESPSERNFWRLLEKYRRQIPDETYNYVLRVVSAAVIGTNPRLFGFDVAPPLGPLPETPTADAGS
ncbi:MAG TPA: transglycosylase SLT domain-containing protein [Gemmatimonadaceae bacterium]